MRTASFGLIPILAAAALFICLPALSVAQNPQPTRDKFVISARAGGVNAVTGGAAVRGHANADWQQLTIKEDLESGDVVKTGYDGRVEMLLNPGSYLRVAENSEFELTNSSLDNLEVKLLRGTAIVEATGSDDSELQINISTPHTKVAIVRRGLYRFNVVPGDNTELIVRKGRVMLDRTKISGGNKVVFNSETFFIAKMESSEKKKVDAFDTWSKDRAETVAQANRRIRGREIGTMVASLRDRWFQNGMSTSAGGFWWFNSRFNCYTFVPFFMGWGSPYGSSYSSAFFPGYYFRRGYVYSEVQPGYYPTASAPSGSISGPSGSAPSVTPRSSGSMDAPVRSPALENRIRRHQDP